MNTKTTAATPGMTPCIIGRGVDNGQGYLRVTVGGKQCREHRVAWEAQHGPIPKGLQLDHLCRNRACVNVEHMELVTSRENTLRGIGPTAKNSRKQQCKNGHSLQGDNLTLNGGHRVCKICHRAHSMTYRAKNREAINAKELARHHRKKAALTKAGKARGE